MTEDDVNKLFGESPRAFPANMLKEKVNQKMEERAGGIAKKSFSQTETKLECLKTRTMKLQIK